MSQDNQDLNDADNSETDDGKRAAASQMQIDADNVTKSNDKISGNTQDDMQSAAKKQIVSDANEARVLANGESENYRFGSGVRYSGMSYKGLQWEMGYFTEFESERICLILVSKRKAVDVEMDYIVYHVEKEGSRFARLLDAPSNAIFLQKLVDADAHFLLDDNALANIDIVESYLATIKPAQARKKGEKQIDVILRNVKADNNTKRIPKPAKAYSESDNDELETSSREDSSDEEDCTPKVKPGSKRKLKAKAVSRKLSRTTRSTPVKEIIIDTVMEEEECDIAVARAELNSALTTNKHLLTKNSELTKRLATLESRVMEMTARTPNAIIYASNDTVVGKSPSSIPAVRNLNNNTEFRAPQNKWLQEEECADTQDDDFYIRAMREIGRQRRRDKMIGDLIG